jgi:hypothetical protein
MVGRKNRLRSRERRGNLKENEIRMFFFALAKVDEGEEKKIIN